MNVKQIKDFMAKYPDDMPVCMLQESLVQYIDNTEFYEITGMYEDGGKYTDEAGEDQFRDNFLVISG